MSEHGSPILGAGADPPIPDGGPPVLPGAVPADPHALPGAVPAGATVTMTAEQMKEMLGGLAARITAGFAVTIKETRAAEEKRAKEREAVEKVRDDARIARETVKDQERKAEKDAERLRDAADQRCQLPVLKDFENFQSWKNQVYATCGAFMDVPDLVEKLRKIEEADEKDAEDQERKMTNLEAAYLKGLRKSIKVQGPASEVVNDSDGLSFCGAFRALAVAFGNLSPIAIESRLKAVRSEVYSPKKWQETGVRGFLAHKRSEIDVLIKSGRLHKDNREQDLRSCVCDCLPSTFAEIVGPFRRKIGSAKYSDMVDLCADFELNEKFNSGDGKKEAKALVAAIGELSPASVRVIREQIMPEGEKIFYIHKGGKGGKGKGKGGGKGVFQGNCNRCGKKGHKAFDCRVVLKNAEQEKTKPWWIVQREKKKKDKAGALIAQSGNGQAPPSGKGGNEPE